MPDAISFHAADFSAWIGLVPKQNSSGGKDKLGSISKQGDRYLRSLFTAGALAVIRYAKLHGTKHRPWLTALLARRPTKVAAIALANKMARMAWAMMTKGERYKEPVALRFRDDDLEFAVRDSGARWCAAQFSPETQTEFSACAGSIGSNSPCHGACLRARIVAS
jgi:hypothetical protein